MTQRDSGTITCTAPTPPPVVTPTPTPTPTSTPTPIPVAQAQTPVATPDRTAPALAVGLKLDKVRRSGKFRVPITLGEKADLTITATARKNNRAKARTILKTTRKGVAAGKPTLSLTLSRKVRAALRKGETVTLTVQARDAAGNVTTRRVTAKVS
jgi:hypothetical protein